MSPKALPVIRVALSGNPNSGKTSLFNALTGAHHKVGNYPGVTVEKREGLLEYRGYEFRVVDLPGTYSLTAYSLDEVVARDFVLEEKPDIVVDVLDSTTLERGLGLCLQFQELGTPLVGALNMSDEALEKGILIDETMLSSTLGIPFVKTVGTDGSGADRLLDAVLDVFSKGGSAKAPHYGAEIESKLGPLEEAILSDPGFAARYPSRWMALKLLENDVDAKARLSGHPQGERILRDAEEARAWLGRHYGKDAEIVVAEQRYGYIRGATREAIKLAPVDRKPVTELVDKFLMNKALGLPLFFAIIWGVFKLTFALGEYPMAWLESFFALIAQRAAVLLPAGFLQSLVVDGIIGGVGGVLSFVPNIVILFLCLSILEDTGYMSRAAFLTDKFLHSFGLHGQSFMPLVMGFGCSVPAIMAARTLKSPKDRIATILAVPFMSCGAKLPVYILLAGTFFPDNPGNAVMSVYVIGVILSLLSTVFLRKTVLKGPTTPFVMELPPYRLPTLRGVVWHVWNKTWQYMKKAGTVILAASILIWAMTTFPTLPNGEELRADLHSSLQAEFTDAEGILDEEGLIARIDTLAAEKNLEYSVAGRIGKFIEPAVRPLGFNWKIGVASVTGFAAKEIVVSTLGILYSAGTEETEESATLREALKRDPDLNPLTAFALMLFILVIPPCFAALATIRAETSWKWLGFQIFYTLALGWVVAFAARMIGLALGLGGA